MALPTGEDPRWGMCATPCFAPGRGTTFVIPLLPTRLYFLFLWGASAHFSPLGLIPPSLPHCVVLMCVPSQNLGLSFPFPCRAALPVIPQAPVRPLGPSLPSSLPGPSSALSIPGWTSLSHCPFPGKGCLAGPGVRDPSQEESQRRKPLPALELGSQQGAPTPTLLPVSFLEISLSKLVSSSNLTPTCGG